jgi:predicted nucleotidyltransferase component of viral defense system
MRLQEGGVSVEMQASPMADEKRTADGEFRLVGGDSIIVRTLEPSEILLEKISAFKDRRKARDLYDVFYLLDYAKTTGVRNALRGLIPMLACQPKDFTGLRELILAGKTPDFETIARKVRSHAK